MFEELQTWPNLKWNTRTQHIWPAVVCHGLQDGRSVRPYVYAAGWLSLRLSCPHLMSFYLDSQHSLFGWRRRKGSKIFYDIKIVWLYPATSWLVVVDSQPNTTSASVATRATATATATSNKLPLVAFVSFIMSCWTSLCFCQKDFSQNSSEWCVVILQYNGETVVATGEGVIRSSTPTVGCCSRYLVKIHSLFAIDFFLVVIRNYLLWKTCSSFCCQRLEQKNTYGNTLLFHVPQNFVSCLYSG